AGLQTVPKESVEAAQVDGATWWTQFRYIELYYLRPLFLLILFFRMADVLRVFDHVFILTGGGPGTATQLLSLYIYRIEFRFFDGGQAAALAVLVLLAVGLVITYPITRLSVPPRLRVGVLNWALSLRFLPPVAVVVPYFAIVRTLQIYNQPIALIGIYSLFNLPFAIWMLKGFL